MKTITILKHSVRRLGQDDAGEVEFWLQLTPDTYAADLCLEELELRALEEGRADLADLFASLGSQ